MSDLADLYQEVILDHNKSPRNFGGLENPDSSADGHNPLCGDALTITIKMDGDQLADVAFEGSGCAISRASASLMTQAIKGRSTTEINELFQAFHSVVTGEACTDDVPLGKLAALAGVAQFPIRVKCATLAWHTLNAALDGKTDAVTTE
jgi:nitrogen fixation NifU-like protein